MLALVLLVPALTPQTAEAVGRAATLAATQNARFEIISELDVEATIEFEAERQRCGDTGESCAAQIAGAYDARLVLFVRIYVVGGETHAALSLNDLEKASVIHRADVSGADDEALYAAVRDEVMALLGRFEGHAADERTRLFVGRAVVDGDVAPPDPSKGLVVGGAVTAAAGVLVALAGGYAVATADTSLAGTDLGGGDQNRAELLRLGGIAGVVVGTVAVLVGAGLVVLGSSR